METPSFFSSSWSNPPPVGLLTGLSPRQVQKLRCEYWGKIKDIPPEKLVFLDEMGIILGAGRTHARSQRGTIIHDLKPFYCGIKVTAIGAITMDKLVALMTRDEALNGQAFAVFIEQFLCPKLWQGAVVVMDNLPAHKVASIVPLIESVGASAIS